MDKAYCEFDPDRVPIEEVRAVLVALCDHLDVKLERREPFHREPEYRFVRR